jgi:hypothetical protein
MNGEGEGREVLLEEEALLEEVDVVVVEEDLLSGISSTKAGVCGSFGWAPVGKVGLLDEHEELEDNEEAVLDEVECR